MANNSVVPHTMLFVLVAVLFCPFASGKVIYVDQYAAGANDGSSWTDAYNFLQDALDDAYSAKKPIEIWVAEGIYTPDSNSIHPNGTGDREATFGLINGVSIYGGFLSGSDELGDRDPNLYVTTLSGDLDENDVPGGKFRYWADMLSRAENSYHIVTGSQTDGTVLLDGFTISGGNARGDYETGADDGGGMYNSGGSPTVTNCTFSENWGVNGGGMYNRESHPTLTSCTFSENSASNGAGMQNHFYSHPSLAKCTFRGNAADFGGGMHNDYSGNPSLKDCTFSENSASDGAGMYNADSSSPALSNCTFSGNSAAARGGGMYNSYPAYFTKPILTTCTFSENSAGIEGGGMYNWRSSPTLTDCTLSRNQADNGNALVCSSSGTAVLSNCIVWDGLESMYSTDASAIIITYSDIQGGWPGVGNIDADPCFTDADNGDYHLKSAAGRWDPNSQTWVQDAVSSPCIDAGDPNTCIGFEPNPNGRIINMGAYGGTAEASLSPSGIECISADRAEYDEWILLGAPACWCYERQCHGDTDCKSQGKQKYWVSTEDLDVLIAAWNKPFAEIEGQSVNTVPLICADFDHEAQGKQEYRVSTNDLDILIANWNIADKPDPNCP